jgi:hypothetical protein
MKVSKKCFIGILASFGSQFLFSNANATLPTVPSTIPEVENIETKTPAVSAVEHQVSWVIEDYEAGFPETKKILAEQEKILTMSMDGSSTLVYGQKY